jgi:hypothetical protein
MKDDLATYGDWRIYVASYSPAARFDWEFVHKDYDGAPDGNDNRCGRGASFQDCIDQIDEIEAEADETLAMERMP